jgi:hypothetical protein
MPVTFEIDPTRALSIVTFSGVFTLEETERALASFRGQGGQKHPCIFEFHRPLAAFEPENIKRICSEMMPPEGGRPTAFVGDTEVSYEVCDAIVRMIRQPGRVRAFKSRAEAEAWLGDRAAGRA